jgi:hypothetical protein
VHQRGDPPSDDALLMPRADACTAVGPFWVPCGTSGLQCASLAFLVEDGGIVDP